MTEAFGKAAWKGEGQPTGAEQGPAPEPFVPTTPAGKLAMAMWEVMGGHIGSHWLPEDFVLYVDRLAARGLTIPDDIALNGAQDDTGL